MKTHSAIDRTVHISRPPATPIFALFPRARSHGSRRIPSPIRVVIVDDQSLVRIGIRAFLETDPEISVVGEAGTGEAGIAIIRELTPDVVLMDILLPDIDGAAATAKVRQESPKTEIVALTSTLEPKWVSAMVRAGAIGYIAKTTSRIALCQAVRAAAVGQVGLCFEASNILVDELRSPAGSVELLSAREMDVLRLLAHGETNKGIGRSLSIGDKTVKTHVSNILAKLGVDGRTQAALIAVERGLVAPSGERLAS